MTCDEAAGLLLEYAEGALPPQAMADVRLHLGQCPACAARASDMRRMLGAFSAARSLDEQIERSTSAADSLDHTTPLTNADGHASPAPPPAETMPSGHSAAFGTGGQLPRQIGDFEIIEEIGRGGMGVVYRARQVSLKRIVALKVLAANLAGSQRTVMRFLKEAQAAARLHHTNIVPIYAQGNEGDLFYYAMELVDGEPLNGVLQTDPTHLRLTPAPSASGAALDAGVRPATDAPAAKTPPADQSPPTGAVTQSAIRAGRSLLHRRGRDYKRVARLMAEAAEALQHAHEQGIVHRDIKPHNLLLGRDDKLHITDFGLARVLDETGLTLSSEIIGTPAYMAPEQITGGRTGIDARTDIFALGTCLYEMLTLKRPFPGETYDQVIHSILRRDPLPPRREDPHIPNDLETICLRALEKEPARRFPSAGEMGRDLRRYATDFPIVSRRVGVVGKTVRWMRRHPARAAALAATVLLLLTMPVLWTFINAAANARINEAWHTLVVEDYRNDERAFEQLGWARHWGGDRHRLRMTLALAFIRNDWPEAVKLVERAVAERPGDREAQYLLAWVYNWKPGSSTSYDTIMEHIRRGDVISDDAQPSTPEGHFFKGQALVETDPTAANNAFKKARALASQANWTFLQAMQHEGRAVNFLLYVSAKVDPGAYNEACSILKNLSDMRTTKALPRYLLSTTHLMAAQIFLHEGRTAEADTALAACLQWAEDARATEPSSARGYVALASYHETRGQFGEALQWWARVRGPQVTVRSNDATERDQYAMRLHFGLGEYKDALDAATLQVEAHDRAFYRALLLRCTGDSAGAHKQLLQGRKEARTNAEWVLLLDAAARLIADSQPDWLRGKLAYDAPLSPKWTPGWRETIVRYQRGEVAWDDLLESIQRMPDVRVDDRQYLTSAAWFYRGVNELAAGRRAAAIECFDKSAWLHDNENYCFRSRMLLYRLQREPGWPEWIPRGE